MHHTVTVQASLSLSSRDVFSTSVCIWFVDVLRGSALFATTAQAELCPDGIASAFLGCCPALHECTDLFVNFCLHATPQQSEQLVAALAHSKTLGIVLPKVILTPLLTVAADNDCSQ